MVVLVKSMGLCRLFDTSDDGCGSAASCCVVYLGGDERSFREIFDGEGLIGILGLCVSPELGA